MNLYSSWVVLWSKNTVVTTGVTRIRTINLMKGSSFIKPVCYSLCNCLPTFKADKSAIQLHGILNVMTLKIFKICSFLLSWPAVVSHF